MRSATRLSSHAFLVLFLLPTSCSSDSCECSGDVICGYTLVGPEGGKTDIGSRGRELTDATGDSRQAPDDASPRADPADVTDNDYGPDEFAPADGGNDSATEEALDPPELPDPLADGTPEDPYLVDTFPLVQDNDTTLSSVSMLNLYNCADWLWEEGPEFYYLVEVPVEGTLKIEVEEADGVDVDIHLLTSLETDGSTAMDCLLRANTLLTAPDLAAGSYWVVIDTYSEDGNSWPGGYRVAFELDLWDEWQEVEVAQGILWRKKLYSDYAGGVQTVNVLDADLSDPAVVFKPHWGNGCIYPSDVAGEAAAVAAVNSGFFSGGCTSMCLIKTDGELKVTNQFGAPRRSFGIAPDGSPMFDSIDGGADWPQAWQAIGGHPNLVTASNIDIWPWEESGFYTARHPRTALGLTATNHLLLVTVDGRTGAGKGMTENELAQHLIYLGAVEAINLDGGGSTTMWVDGMSVNGIVNHPSDNEEADHHGERKVSDALLLFSAK